MVGNTCTRQCKDLQTNKHTSKQTNTQTNKHTNKQTNKQKKKKEKHEISLLSDCFIENSFRLSRY